MASRAMKMLKAAPQMARKMKWNFRKVNLNIISQSLNALNTYTHTYVILSVISFASSTGGYGWVIVAIAFVTTLMWDGSVFTFALFIPYYLDEFKKPLIEVVFVGSIFAGFTLFISGWTGDLADRYNNKALVFASAIITALGYYLASLSTALWQLYLTQGLIVGFGYSLGVTTITPVICHWFDKRSGLANGINGLSGGLGTVFNSLVTGKLLELYGWQTTLKILALIVLVIFSVASVLLVRRIPLASSLDQSVKTSIKTKDAEVLSAEMQPSDRQIVNNTSTAGQNTVTTPRVESSIQVSQNQDSLLTEESNAIRIEYNTNKSNNSNMADVDGTSSSTDSCYQTSKIFFSDPKFVLIFVAYMLYNFGLCIPYIYLPLYAQTLGYSISLSNLLLLLIGVGATVGSAVIGVLADFCSCLLLVRVCMLVAGIFTLVWLAFTNIIGLYFYAVIFGIFAGAVLSIMTEMCAELYGLERLGAVLGIIYASLSVGDFLASPIGATMVESVGGYPTVISVAGVFMIVASVLIDLACDSSVSVVNRTSSALSRYHTKSSASSFRVSNRQTSLQTIKSIRSLEVQVASYRGPISSSLSSSKGTGEEKESDEEGDVRQDPAPRYVSVSLIKSSSTYLFGS